MVRRFKTVFVLGGPGSGKGTQSELIQKTFKFIHLSAGHLLREQQNRRGSMYGSIIQKIILDGQIVPSHITISLLQAAMKARQQDSRYFLIDGFPRNLQNFTSWRDKTRQLVDCPFVLHFKCSEEQMIKRLLKRGESSNRSDDNLQVIHKRFQTYQTQTQQVLKELEKDTKVHHISSDPPVEEIFNSVKPIFEDFFQKQQSLMISCL